MDLLRELNLLRTRTSPAPLLALLVLLYSCRLKLWEGSQEQHSPMLSIHSDYKAVVKSLLALVAF